METAADDGRGFFTGFAFDVTPAVFALSQPAPEARDPR